MQKRTWVYTLLIPPSRPLCDLKDKCKWNGMFLFKCYYTYSPLPFPSGENKGLFFIYAFKKEILRMYKIGILFFINFIINRRLFCLTEIIKAFFIFKSSYNFRYFWEATQNNQVTLKKEFMKGIKVSEIFRRCKQCCILIEGKNIHYRLSWKNAMEQSLANSTKSIGKCS